MADLNINNYNLADILSLFRIPSDMTEVHMKKAKQMVLKTHPDKSGLPSEYFLFYSSAYKVLYSIYTFKNKADHKRSNNVEYSPESVLEDSTEHQHQVLDTFFEKNKAIKDPKQFNEWFNKQFEQSQINETDTGGYGDWLKTDADIYKQESGSMSEQINKHKQHAKSVVVYGGGISEMNSTFGGTLLGEPSAGDFSSSMFSGLAYQDIKQAHTETVIPITDQDYADVKKFNNVEEYSRYRSEQNTAPLSEADASAILNRRVKDEEDVSTSRAYYYAKQQEDVSKKNTQFWGRLQSLM